MVFMVFLETLFVFMLHSPYWDLLFKCCVMTPAMCVHDVLGSLGYCCHTSRLSKVRCIHVEGELNLAFDHCRCEYIKMMQGDDSLWESFPGL